MNVAILLSLHLVLAGDHHAACAAAKEASEHLGRWSRCLAIAPALGEHALHLVKELLGNDRLVLSFMHFTAESKMAVVERIRENPRDIRATDTIALGREHPVLHEEILQGVERFDSFRIPLEHFLHNAPALAVNNDSLQAIIVHVSERGWSGVFAPANLFAQAAFRVLGQRVNVVFALAERHVEHELALRGVLEPKGRELERRKFPGVERIRDAASVNTVA